MTPPEEATLTIGDILADLSLAEANAVVEALHAIIADVIDSCALAARSHVMGDTTHQTDIVCLNGQEFAADLLTEDITETVNDYVANHYGVEEFGL